MENPLYLLVIFSFIVIVNGTNIGEKLDDKESQAQIYIVYLGEKPHDDHEIITKSHHDMLAEVLGSEETEKLMVYSYKHSFSGFAAKLTEAEAKKLAETPGVLRVIRDRHYKLQNTRSWSTLGLSTVGGNPNNLLHQAHMGDGIIIGVIDSGIWADSKAFHDDGLGPIPSRWKGVCKSEGLFDASKHCNRKIIGARWYKEGYLHKYGVQAFEKNPSPLDTEGHGTHVASTVAGSFVNNVTYYGLNMGTFRGGAPRARLAMYKTGWVKPISTSTSSDILAAFDDAVRDGVDVISASIGGSFPDLPEVSEDNPLAIGAFHAVAHGIPVVEGAGNDCPLPSSTQGFAPWVISVAATTVDRAFLVPITLGNNKTIMGRGKILGKEVGFAELTTKELPEGKLSDSGSNKTSILEFKGKVVVVFISDKKEYIEVLDKVPALDARALIVVRPVLDNELAAYAYGRAMPKPQVQIPIVEIDFEAGNDILEYDQKSCGATVSIGQTFVHEGKPLPLKVAGLSSRGPNAVAPEILKPDVAAPGVSILAAVPPDHSENDNGFVFLTGTSMATPHVSGIVALLRSLHRHWSPAAIRSALVTTAWNEDTSRTPINAEGSPANLANAFDYGGGIVNPNAAAQPGLVYDMNKENYLNYLCIQDYNMTDIYNATKESPYFNPRAAQSICDNRGGSLLDLNLPSFTVPHLNGSATLKRRVTNVGPTNSVYKATIKSPRGVRVSVKPEVLKFNSKAKEADFVMKVVAEQEYNTGYVFGSLTWSDGKHSVRSPVTVRTTFYPIF